MNILLGITGGIAAYKTPELVRRLREQGAQVKVVMTEGAKAFITPLTLQAVSGDAVHETLLSTESEAIMGHIELARWADKVIVAPATAHFIAQLTHGFASDLLTTLCLATQAPIILAPAMNQQMWLNPRTQANVQLLKQQGVTLLGPGVGDQACGENGPGRMLEPQQIADALLKNSSLLAGKKVLITAGPTQEAIDPVRYLTNRSSGKMGYALAHAASQAGAEVLLISGPTALTVPAHVTCIRVKTAEEMYQAVMKQIASQDIFIAAAAVADYTVAQVQSQKIKKQQNEMTLQLVKTKDILASVGALKHKPFTVGFAAETQQVIEYGQSKLRDKKCQLIVANPVGENQGFDSDENEVFLITEQSVESLARADKKYLAQMIIERIATKTKSP